MYIHNSVREEARNGTWIFAATFLMPSGAVTDTVEQLGIRQKQWPYELLLRIKHRFGVSALFPQP